MHHRKPSRPSAAVISKFRRSMQRRQLRQHQSTRSYWCRCWDIDSREPLLGIASNLILQFNTDGVGSDRIIDLNEGAVECYSVLDGVENRNDFPYEFNLIR